MAEQRPEDFSANGTYSEAAVGIAESVDEEASPSLDQAEPTEIAESADDAAAPTPNDGADFLAQLAGAMRATAATERKRIDEDIDRRRDAHLETIRDRRDSEAEKMRELAADDLKAIDDWAEGERQRIDQEREQKAAALKDDLEKSLAEHGTQIDGEIAGVEGAITGYRAEVDTFFAKLDAETDPVEIARLAGQRPAFPDLASVPPSTPVATVTAEPGEPAVGVMEPEAAADPATAWSQWNATTAPAEAAESPVTAEAGTAGAAAPSSLLQSVAVSRPYANLIGDSTDDH
jgi:hypothetical protein